jgi:hypothetical protein
MEADAPLEPAEVPVEAAVPKRTRRPPEPDRGPFFTDLWQGIPLFRCPICRVARTDRPGMSGDLAIRAHITRHHATARPTPEQRARASGLVITKR